MNHRGEGEFCDNEHQFWAVTRMLLPEVSFSEIIISKSLPLIFIFSELSIQFFYYS